VIHVRVIQVRESGDGESVVADVLTQHPGTTQRALYRVVVPTGQDAVWIKGREWVPDPSHRHGTGMSNTYPAWPLGLAGNYSRHSVREIVAAVEAAPRIEKSEWNEFLQVGDLPVA
jgi:hypothetical protein